MVFNFKQIYKIILNKQAFLLLVKNKNLKTGVLKKCQLQTPINTMVFELCG